MSRKEMIASAVEHLRTRAGMKTVYGEPVVMNGKTIIPVAKVAHGKTPHAPHDGGAVDAVAAEAGNGAAAGTARPVGLVEITDKETRFVSFGQVKRVTIAAAVGSGLGIVLGWILGRRKGGGA